MKTTNWLLGQGKDIDPSKHNFTVFISRCYFGHGQSRPSVSSWRRRRSAGTMRSARRTAMPWWWTPGVKCWATAEGRSQVWCWWRWTWRRSAAPGETCRFKSTAETLVSITVWRRLDYKRNSTSVSLKGLSEYKQKNKQNVVLRETTRSKPKSFPAYTLVYLSLEWIKI